MSLLDELARAAASAVACPAVRLPAFVVTALAGLLLASAPAQATGVTVYKSATCGCCNAWIKHLEANGFSVKAQNVNDLDAYKRRFGVTPQLAACHTAIVDGYVVEGHVPAADIKQLLAQRPKVKGIAVPGMPMGSPGMEGPSSEPYNSVTFDEAGRIKVYARH
jgi:hypothetical protein